MKKIMLFLFIFSIFACSKVETSDCMTAKIDKFKIDASEKGASIDVYSFEGKEVYLFYGGDFPDAGTSIINTNCDEICFLGGIAGFTMCNGKDFNKEAKFVKNIWKK